MPKPRPRKVRDNGSPRKLPNHAPEPPYHGRTLHFIRHGQYDSGPGGSGRLTGLGRRQARTLAKHFSGMSVASIRSSDLPRAVETAQILAEALGIDERPRHRLLRELLPTSLPLMRVPRENQREAQETIERVLKRFFTYSARPRQDIVVCHGNLIRALVIRVATGRFGGWHRFAIHHGSVTSFVVRPNGIIVVGMNQDQHVGDRWRSQS